MENMTSHEERFGFRAQGKFRCALSLTTPALICAGILYVSMIPFVLTDNLTMKYLLGSWSYGPTAPVRVLITAIFLIVSTAALGVAAGILLHGADYYYEADDNVFMIYRDIGNDRRVLDEAFYYSDVLEVSYYDAMFHRGYLVEIRTAYRVVKYRYVFLKNKDDHSTESTPFYIIEQRAGLRGELLRKEGRMP